MNFFFKFYFLGFIIFVSLEVMIKIVIVIVNFNEMDFESVLFFELFLSFGINFSLCCIVIVRMLVIRNILIRRVCLYMELNNFLKLFIN